MGAGRPKSIDNAKVFDVAKPGKAKPLSTSRPVVGQAITVRDTSVLPDSNDQKTAVKPLAAPSVTRKVIKPLTEEDETFLGQVEPENNVVNFTETAPELEAKEAEEAAIKPKKETKKLQIVDSTANTAVTVTTGKGSALPSTAPEEKASSSTSIPSEIEQNEDAEEVAQKDVSGEDADPDTDVDSAQSTSDTPEAPEATQEATGAAADAGSEGSESASVDALAEASEKPKLDQKALEEQAKRDAALQELIDSKKYFVPLAHDSSKPKRRGGVGVVFLVILLLLIGAYLLIDAEVIKTSLTLPYEFIK